MLAELAKTQTRLTDVQSRERRNNIRIIGLPEDVEGSRPSLFFPGLLQEVFGKELLVHPPECDRAHRAFVTKPTKEQNPRAVIIRIHKYQVKETIIHKARAKRGSLLYKGHRIAVYEDYAPEIRAQCNEYKEVMSGLWQMGFKPSLLFLAKLSKQGARRRFASAAEAEDFLTKAHKALGSDEST